MPTVTAKLRYLAIAPKKVRLAANVIKGMAVERAEAELKARPKRASRHLAKLLHSAVANAENTKHLSKRSLIVKNVLVDPGPSLKRILPRAMGRATPIWKRTSHVTLILESVEPEKAYEERKAEAEIKEKAEGILRRRSPEEEKPKFIPKKEAAAAKRELRKGFVQRIFRRKAI